MIKSSVEKITPAKAAKWMEGAENIRRVRKHRVNMWAEKLRRGMFTLSNDAICVDEDGKLLNGWHRCSAVIETGIPFDAIVLRGMPKSSAIVMDKGLKRLASDSINVPRWANVIAAAAKLYLMWDKNITHNTAKAAEIITEEDIIELANDNIDEFTAAAEIASSLAKAVGGSTTVWTTFIYRTSQINETSMLEFVNSIRTGANLAQGDPRLAVRNWFINQQVGTRRKSSILNQNALHIIAQGWNAWLRGDKRDKLHLPRVNATKTVTVPQPEKPFVPTPKDEYIRSASAATMKRVATANG